jgi:hypothetical protein
LDRVLLWNYYFVPQWHNPDIWVAYWDKFGIPDEQPDYVGVDLDSWWIIGEREEAIEIEEALRGGRMTRMPVLGRREFLMLGGAALAVPLLARDAFAQLEPRHRCTASRPSAT